MHGESFISEDVERAHDDCHMCDIITTLAVNNFRESGSLKTRSESGTHWVEVTPRST